MTTLARRASTFRRRARATTLFLCRATFQATRTVRERSSISGKPARTILRSPENPLDPSGSRVAATSFDGSNYTVTLNVSQAHAFKLSVYALDWDTNGRDITLSVDGDPVEVNNTWRRKRSVECVPQWRMGVLDRRRPGWTTHDRHQLQRWCERRDFRHHVYSCPRTLVTCRPRRPRCNGDIFRRSPPENLGRFPLRLSGGADSSDGRCAPNLAATYA